MHNGEFRELVLKSIEHTLSLLASEGLKYPDMTITGGAAILLAEPRLREIFSTGDVDLLLESPADIDDIFYTLVEIERRRPDEIFTVATKGIVELTSLKRKDLLPVDFVGPVEPRIREVFQYTSRNAKDVLAELSVNSHQVKIHLAKLEDAILCKLAVGREKDITGVKPIISKLRKLGRLDLTYMHKLARKFGLDKELQMVFGRTKF